MKTLKIENLVILSILILLIISCTKFKLIENREQLKVISNNNHNEFLDLGNGWFQITESIAIVDITPEKAKENAIQKACKRAIEYFSGVEISRRIVEIQAENQSKILLDNFSSITNQTTQGIILEKEIISEEIVSDGSKIEKVVTIKVRVGKQKGEKDYAFQIESNLNREYFKDGEELELSVKSSKDCYLTILNVCSNDSVYVIFPNEYRRDNFIKSGELFQLPNSDDKEIGLFFPVNLLPNKKEDVEMIKVIATKQKIDFASLYSFSAYGTYQSTLIDLQYWLLRIPRNEIEEVDLQYFIGR
ncbi:MAG: DUF4384 domain-containing protein [Candidatus Cloacimonetes bacterium]|nr:DUF4384 domain-containing protein [Candidatus Cloacimonadota bacterium]